MSVAQQRLYNAMKRSNSLETIPGSTPSRSAEINASIDQIVGNPLFKAEFTIQVFIRYYSQAAVGTPVAAVPAAGQQTNLPLYLFGFNDFTGAYARGRQLVPGGGGWTYADMKMLIVGQGEVDYNPLPHAAAGVDYASGTIFNGLAANGDLLFLIPMAGFVAGAAATTHTAEIVIHCANVPYTSLLAALSSDKFTINMIRYVVPVANVAQLAQQITPIKNSLFGKASFDTIDPQTFITPGTMQPQIADMPLSVEIDKNMELATQLLYTAVVPIQISMTFTVSSTAKN